MNRTRRSAVRARLAPSEGGPARGRLFVVDPPSIQLRGAPVEYEPMNKLRNLSIAWKLYASFGLVLGLLCLNAAVGLWSTSSLGHATGSITGTSVPKVTAALQLKFDAADLNGWQTAYVLDSGKSRQPFVASGSQFVRELARVKALSTDAADKSAVAKVAANYTGFDALDSKVWAAIKRGDITEARRIALGPEIAKYNVLAKSVEDYVVQAQAEVVASNRTFASTKSSATMMTLIVALLALLIGGTVSFVLARYIRGALSSVVETLESLSSKCAAWLSQGMQAMADGDLTRRIEPVTPEIVDPSSDEIGDAARAANGIRSATIESLASYNAMAEKLSTMIGEIRETSQTLLAASEEMAATSEETGKAVSEIAEAVG